MAVPIHSGEEQGGRGQFVDFGMIEIEPFAGDETAMLTCGEFKQPCFSFPVHGSDALTALRRLSHSGEDFNCRVLFRQLPPRHRAA